MECISFFPKPKLLGTSDPRTPFFSWKRKLASPGIGSFKQKLFTDGTSKEFVSLISGAQRPEKCAHYESLADLVEDKLIQSIVH